MRCFAQILDLKNDPELITAYREHHTRVWPEVVDSLREIGLSRLKIFLHGTRLVMYFEAPDDFDPSHDFQTYASNPRCQEWDELMRRFQKQVPGATNDSWWTPMASVFDLETC